MVSDPESASRDGVYVARARGRIEMADETLARIIANSVEKGDVLGTARFAAVQSLVSPSSASPFRPAPPVDAEVNFRPTPGAIEVEVVVTVSAPPVPAPGALGATTVALLNVFDMCKAIDRGMSIGPVELVAE